MLGSHVFLDADDTLWDNQSHHDAAEDAFVRRAVERGPTESEVVSALRGAHNAVIEQAGVGPHTHIQAVREAWRRLFGPLDLAAATLIDDCFRSVFRPERALLPGVAELLPRLAQRHHIVLLTRGVEEHQLDKVHASGLAHHFREVHVVADKTPELFRQLVAELDVSPERACMVGDSTVGDIRPALEAGLWGIHIPFERQAHFLVDPDGDALSHARLLRLRHFGELERLLHA